jgi:carbon-monoxide dehydrogenase large subunit
MIGANRYIGSPVERIEDFRFLRGRGQFVGDLKREGMLHAAILRSPIAHGRLIAVDATVALTIPGVRAVITASDIGAVPRIPLRLLPLPGTERFLQPVIAQDRVRYVGEPIAVVLTDNAALAEDGVGAIILDTEELPPIADRRASAREDALLFEESGTNVAMTFTGTKGDTDAAFREAAYVRRERFEALYGIADGAARPACRVGCGAAADDGSRRGKGTVLQSRHRGRDARAVVCFCRPYRERCRRRVWRPR